MVDRNRKRDQSSQLQQAQVAARTGQSASAQLVEFAERLGAGDRAGRAARVRHPDRPRGGRSVDRVEAFGRLGFGAPSLDATGPPDA